MLKSLVIAAAVLTATAAHAAGPRDNLLVSTDWLASHLSDPNLVILQLGSKTDYDAAHIPGARFVAQNTLSVTGPAPTNLTLEMPAPEDLRTRLAGLGISDNSRIVVVYG